jgi:hemerythrin
MTHLPDTLRVGVDSIDQRHEEFWVLHQRLINGSDSEFTSLFDALIEHTKGHFAEEEGDMETIVYANKSEHRHEHQKALEEMNYFRDKAQGGKMMFAKAYANERLGDWFRNHLLNMDSDLARAISLSR